MGGFVAQRRASMLVIGIVSGALLVQPGASDATAAPAPLVGPSATYLVQLADAPVASYRGTVRDLRSTRPNPGARLDAGSPDVRRYLAHLADRRSSVLARVPGARRLYDYSYTFSGFAAQLTGEQAATLAAAPGVVAVIRDGRRRLDTHSTPDFLGLTGESGVWSAQFGGPARAGNGVIVGVIDGGLWPENPSFAPLAPSDMDLKVARRFRGACVPGIETPTFTCNNKVIGGRYFVRGMGVDNVLRSDYLSPRDYSGHGSHVASTAAGNADVRASAEGRPIGVLSGMAPAARIAAYKACWIVAEPNQDNCADSDLVAAIDSAVADGVDVLNFSIGGSRTSTIDPVEIAFRRAAEAGVFVAASAGNSGPSVTTVAHNSPWVTTVAASTHPGRTGSAQLTLGDGRSVTGVGIGGAVPASPIVLAATVGRDGAPANEVLLCYPDRLDPAKVAGAIVVCDRGVNARPDKSRAVRQAGGVGMVLVNPTANTLNADLHYVPTVHVDAAAGALVKAYAAGTPQSTATLAEAVVGPGPSEPKVATFSSRGPALAGAGDLLKPDLMAPGVEVLAAVSPAAGHGRSWDVQSGTSMSAPHVAGLAGHDRGQAPALVADGRQVRADDQRPRHRQGGQADHHRDRRRRRSARLRLRPGGPRPRVPPRSRLRQHARRLGPLPLRHRRARHRPTARSRAARSTPAT